MDEYARDIWDISQCPRPDPRPRAGDSDASLERVRSFPNFDPKKALAGGAAGASTGLEL